MPSSYWFRVTLEPADACRFSTPSDVMVGDIGFLALGSTLWVRAVQWEESFDFIRGHVDDTVRLLLGAYAIGGGRGLTHRLESWVQEHDRERGTATVGHIHEADDWTPDDQQTAMLTNAAALVAQVVALGDLSWRFALLDLTTACREDQGDDAFLCAYRAVQDCVRAISPTDDDSEWALLHAHLGLTTAEFQESFRSLWQARDKIAHGDREAPELEHARQRRPELINLARTIVRNAIQRALPLEQPRAV